MLTGHMPLSFTSKQPPIIYTRCPTQQIRENFTQQEGEREKVDSDRVNSVAQSQPYPFTKIKQYILKVYPN